MVEESSGSGIVRKVTFVFESLYPARAKWTGEQGSGPGEALKFFYGALQVTHLPFKPDGSADTANETTAYWDQVNVGS